MNDIKIIDNFLDQKKFEKIQTTLFGQNFAWYYRGQIDFKDELTDKFQFFHYFYSETIPTSTSLDLLNPIFEKIKLISLWRVKANLLTRTPNIVENSFHVDMLGVSEKKTKQWTTSIFYMNTNNGYTKFEDGTKVESIANRMITFPSNMKHTGTSCTDEKIRVVINFNYFENI